MDARFVGVVEVVVGGAAETATEAVFTLEPPGPWHVKVYVVD